MVIYRVEKDGLGPYHNGTWKEEIGVNHNDDIERPCGITREEHHFCNAFDRFDVPNFCDYLFGFADKQQLFNWFEEWLYLLNRDDFKIVTYESEDFQASKKQVIFKRDSAKILGIESCENCLSSVC